MSDYLAVSEERKHKIRKATIEDELRPKVIVTIQNGLNEMKNPEGTKPYYNIRYEFSVENNIVYGGERWLILNSMRKKRYAATTLIYRCAGLST